MTVTMDIYQVGGGVLLGIVIGALMKIRLLHRLDLNIQKIGLNMGIEGVDAPESGGGLNVWHSPVGGDVVGRDKKTTIGTQIQKILGSKSSGPVIKLRTSQNLQSKDKRFIERLKAISENKPSNDVDVISACLERKEFAEPIEQFILELAKQQCRVVSATVDRSGDGFVMMYEVERTL